MSTAAPAKINRRAVVMQLAAVRLQTAIEAAQYTSGGVEGLTGDDLEQAARRALSLYVRNPSQADIDQLLADWR